MVNKDLNAQVGIPYRSEIAPSIDVDPPIEQDVTAGPLNDVEDGSYARAVLIGLQLRTNGSPDIEAAKARRRHKSGRTNANDPFRPVVYMGTVDPVTVAERRAKNKVARKRRVANARRARR